MLCLIALLPALCLGQQKRTVLLTASIKEDTVKNPGNGPTFKITIKNTGDEMVSTPKRSIISPYTYRQRFIKLNVEEITDSQASIQKVLSDSDGMAPIRCNICFFGNGESDYLNKSIRISTGQNFTLEEFVVCYKFIAGSKYRVKFSLDAEKIGAAGQTDWIYFQVQE